MFETVKIKTKPCCMCGKSHELEVLKDDYLRWKAGAFVQVAFPEMPPPEREMLISGTCPECFAVLFPEEED